MLAQKGAKPRIHSTLLGLSILFNVQFSYLDSFFFIQLLPVVLCEGVSGEENPSCHAEQRAMNPH